MSPEKIKKIRELAQRGEGGEKQNAINMLKKLGLPIEEPKLSFKDKTKKFFGSSILRTYRMEIKLTSDLFLLQKVIDIVVGHTNTTLSITQYGYISFKVNEAQMKDINSIYQKFRNDFYYSMSRECKKYIQSYFN